MNRGWVRTSLGTAEANDEKPGTRRERSPELGIDAYNVAVTGPNSDVTESGTDATAPSVDATEPGREV